MRTINIKNKHGHSFSRPYMLAFVLIFATVGTYFLLNSFASNPNLPGDENNDGVVNLTDLSILLSNWNSTNTNYDLNGDGIVNVLDLSVLLSHYGQTGTVSNPKVTFGAAPTSVVSGLSSTLAWTSQGMSSCSISPNIGTVKTNGTHDSGNITAVITFTLTCTGTGGTATAQTTIGVGSTGSSTANINVDFGKVIQQTSAVSYAIDESGYPGGGPVLGNDTNEQQAFKTLGVGMVRMGLKYATPGNPSSAIQCNGSGCDTSLSGDAYIQAIRTMGAEPIIIVPFQNTVDDANLVKHYNKDLGWGVKRWIVGNETSGGSAAYSPAFDAAYNAMKAVDPTILVGGPASADFFCCSSTNFIPQFLDAEGSKVDFIDFHTYSESYPGSGVTDAGILTLHYQTKVNQLRDVITQKQPNRNISIEVGEYNMDTANADPRLNQPIAAVWHALVLGKILTAGGLALPYTTKNYLLGLVDGSDKPTPSYHGYGMYTGENLFRKFGTQIVQSGSDNADVDTFASANSKNIVVVNKNPNTTNTLKFTLSNSTSTSADVWLKDPSLAANAAPHKVATVSISNNTFSYTLPGYGIATFVLN